MMEQPSTKNDFGKGSVARNIIGMAVPMTLAQILNLLYNLVDRIYIGHIPGTDSLALTGVGVTFPIVSMLMAFASLYGMGGSPLCSMARGEQNLKRAGDIMENSFWMLLFTGALVMLVLYAIKRPLLYALGASDATYPYANAYLSIYLIGTLFVMISLGMNPFINSQGFGKIGMATVSLGAVVNLILDPIFIFGLGLGVKGAAAATVIAQLCSAIWVLHFLLGEKPILRLRIRRIRLDFPLIRQIMALGAANFIMNLTNSLVQVVCNRQLQIYGGDLYVGIMTVINSVRDVSTALVHGVTSGAQPVLGFNYGARLKNRVKQGIRFMVFLGCTATCMVWIATLAIPEPIIRLFNSDAELIRAGIPAMQIYFFGFCFMSLQFSGQATFQALGEAKYAIFFSIFRKVIIVVPLTLLLPLIPSLGIHGVFLAEPISNLIGGCASFATMIVVVWKGKLRE